MKLTTARLKKLIREELSRMNEMSYDEGPGYSTYEYEPKDKETPEQAEKAMKQTEKDYDVIMIKIPQKRKDEFLKHFGDEKRHGDIDDEYYSLTYKN